MSITRAIAVAFHTTHASAAILNGSFESIAESSPTRVDIVNATSWTALGGQMLLERAVNGVSQIAAQDGDQFVSMGHNSAVNDTLSQIIITAPGSTQEVSFFVACIQGNSFQTITASAVETSTNTVLGSVVAEVSSLTAGWIGYSFQFQPTGESTTLRFVHNTASDGANIALDNVSVVPAPSLAALLPLAGISVGRRRR